ncbi:hypothetical protein K443DRAFT_15589 [Laccaria amethystina LaAM-08-1]|uniref:Uncharacterized protein n=1 Tax=Laccaria amethystina LaAM-08-1 TaxID=1095629 RepID=A0A0C9WL66_9AGAR|nr:hypothetical protein K443DRAFT_15589 [Laccaria amethystina LaAM-08-1]
MSAVVGTSLGVGIPLIMLRRQGRTGLHLVLNSNSPPLQISQTSISLAPGPHTSPIQQHHAHLKNNLSQNSPSLAFANLYRQYLKPILPQTAMPEVEVELMVERL